MLCLLFCLGIARAASPATAPAILTLFPGAVGELRNNRNAFALQNDGDRLVISFHDSPKPDDNAELLLCPVSRLMPYCPGGYVEIVVDIDRPIARMSAMVIDPRNFWATVRPLEGNANLSAGTNTLRFYLDNVDTRRLDLQNDQLYLFFQDLVGPPLGDATITVRSVTVHPQEADWHAQKQSWYRQQYHWPPVEPIEPLYRDDFSRAVDWAEVNSAPGLGRLSLDGAWSKKSFGMQFWNYAFLADTSSAGDAVDSAGWGSATVPEPPQKDSPTGFTWYRKTFQLPANFSSGRTYLRLEDVADDATIFLNGKRVGTQCSTTRDYQWVVQNGSRHANTAGKIEQAMNYQNFSRLGITAPFDPADIPSGQTRLLLPLETGNIAWPLAYDVSDLLRSGENVLAVRVFGNPVRGWWVLKHPQNRAADHVFGLLGDVDLVNQKVPVIQSMTRTQPTTVDDMGNAVHRFIVTLLPGAPVAQVHLEFSVDGNSKAVGSGGDDGKWSAAFTLPATFAQHHARVCVIDAADHVVDQRDLEFHGVVIETHDKQFRVNGEPYLVRGVNADPGIDWHDDRTVTRAEFRRQMDQWEQLGFNSIRCNFLDPDRLRDAQEAGLMAMPAAVAGSTDYLVMALGQLDSPDLQLATDRHREMAIQLRDCPNILFWNTGNEMHHTPGRDDRDALIGYLEQARAAVNQFDPYHHPATFANLDMVSKNWFFTQGQDVIGFNVYSQSKIAQRDIAELLGEVDRPLVFTEWGTYAGKPDRNPDVAKWEGEMTAKWQAITQPGCIGGFIYAWHGELEDPRGIWFLRSLMMPFTMSATATDVTIHNRDVASMHQLALRFYCDGELVLATPEVESLAAGAEQTLKLPAQLAHHDRASVEIRYTTHGGLAHRYVLPWPLETAVPPPTTGPSK